MDLPNHIPFDTRLTFLIRKLHSIGILCNVIEWFYDVHNVKRYKKGHTFCDFIVVKQTSISLYTIKHGA